MSINWVMLDGRNTQAFVSLPGERALYSSPTRTSFYLSTSNSLPGATPIKLNSNSGVVHLTNQRIIYIPTQRTTELESFSCPINHLHDTHVSAPFFGPNVWTAVVQPVSNGGLPPVASAIELKLVFKDGGAFDFYTIFERVKERFLQALENARASGRVAEGGPMGAVHLEDLPAYEEPPAMGGDVSRLVGTDTSYGGAPPGYEEVQRESLAEEEVQRQYNGLNR